LAVKKKEKKEAAKNQTVLVLASDDEAGSIEVSGKMPYTIYKKAESSGDRERN
jgi:hypothetical protein